MSTIIDIDKKLTDLGLDKSQIIRAMEAMNAAAIDLTPASLAQQLGIPKSIIYQDIEILEYIYSHQNEVTGLDKLIEALLKKIKNHRRHIAKLKKQLDNDSKSSQEAYNEGFLKGASMNYKNKPQLSVEIAKELWARGVLQIDLEAELSSTLVKSSYRRLVTLFHPDQSARDSGEQLNTLKKAYDLLLKLYS